MEHWKRLLTLRNKTNGAQSISETGNTLLYVIDITICIQNKHCFNIFSISQPFASETLKNIEEMFSLYCKNVDA